MRHARRSRTKHAHSASAALSARSYFALATAAVHVSADRVQLARTVYDALASELAKLPDDHPNQATVASAKAYALFVLGDVQVMMH